MSAIDPSVLASTPTRRWSRAEYERMVEVGLLGEDDRVELIAGVLVQMSPIGTKHASTVSELLELLVVALRRRAQLRAQSPLAADDSSEPEPDLAVVARGDYTHEHPRAALLVIEVADSSLRIDRIKAAVYAQAAVPEYWIVNLVDGTVEVYTQPRGAQYGSMRTLQRGESLTLLAFPDVTLAVDDFLPPR
jgi:Uma2 family endonuclease